MFRTEDYTCLEVFAKTKEGRQGEITVKSSNGDCRTYAAGSHYYTWLKIPVEPDREYNMVINDAEISLAYLSGCPDILNRGITFLNLDGGGSLVTEEDYVRQYDTSYREQYHFVPWKNWINDPNGLCWYQDRYHMFYQYNPHGQEWSNMYWGHAVSKDLVHWTHLPVVLEPQPEILEQAEILKGGAFSGCAVAQEEEVIFYLTRHIGPMEDCEDTVQTQWMIRSRDAVNMGEEKLIIGERPQGASFDFRDPKVTKIGEVWYMVLASAIGDKAAILLYTSADMEDWTYIGPLLTEPERGVQCFECPDFFELDGTYVAVGAWMTYVDASKRFQMSRYYIGDFNGKELEIKNSGWFDFGSNCYAMQSFEKDGRRISIGWISDFYGEHVKVPNGAYGSMTLPRELHVRNGRLFLTPAEEVYHLKREIIYEGSRPDVKISQISGNSYYAKVVFESDTEFSILLGEDNGRSIRFGKSAEGVGIKTSGVKSESVAFPADVETVEELEIFVDRRVVEIYINKGEAAGTKLFYNSKKSGCFQLEARDEKAVKAVEVAVMKSIWK